MILDPGGIATIGLGWFVAQGKGTFWMPPQASSTAASVDRVFNLIYWISLFFFSLIVALAVLFVIRYRSREGHRAQKTAAHHTALELTWTIIPLIIVVIIFVAGFRTYVDMAVPPANAREIQVTAQKWKWFFRYPNGYEDGDLHVPVHEPVRLVMTSEDVIHSFYVPAFRTQMNVVPGRYTKVWFQATDPGEYDLFCSLYCGTGHSDMIARVVVHPPGEYEKWLENAGNWVSTVPPAEAGKILVVGRADGRGGKGCNQCHRVDGVNAIGPTLKGLFGSTVTLKDGRKVVADENYIRESIVEPQASIVAGYDPVMPTYKGRLKDQEITAIIEYIKTLSDGAAKH